MTRNLLISAAFLATLLAGLARASAADPEAGREWHVSVHGDDRNDGSSEKTFRTIAAAAARAMAGDVVTVHEGIYRERIDPPRGGTSDDRRTVYRAAAGERAEITGSGIRTRTSGPSSSPTRVWRVQPVLVTMDGLGEAAVSGLPFENAAGTALRIDTDYFGRPRAPSGPLPGPLESRDAAAPSIKVWPVPPRDWHRLAP